MAVEAFRSRIGSALSNRDFAEVEAAWREYATLHPEDHEYLLNVAGQLSRYEKGPLAGELCLSLAKALLEKGEADAAFSAARGSLKASQKTEGLRDFLVKAYETRYASNEHLATFLEKSGLAEEGGGMRQQVDAMDRYLAFEEGAYVFHPGGWGYGVVADFDPAEEQMVVDFQKKPGHRIGILSATKILQRLADDHIGVYKHYRRTELDELIQTDPAKVFHLFLKSSGGKATLKQVREELVPDVLDKNAWSRWWSKAKKALLVDPLVRIGRGSSPELELRAKAKTIEEEVAEKMRARATGREKVAIAREYLRSLDLTPELAASVAGEIDAALGSEPKPPSRLALLYLKADLKVEGSAQAAEDGKEIAAGTEDLLGLLKSLEPSDRKRAVHDLITSGSEGWADRVGTLLHAGDNEIADVALEDLNKHRPDLLISLFNDLSANPRGNPSMFLWYAKGMLHGTIPEELAAGEKASTVMEKLLTLADQIGLEQKRTSDAELKEWLRHVRSFFTARRFKMFKAFTEEATLSYARYLYAKIQRNRGFTDQTKQALLDVVEGMHPEIHTAPEEDREVEVVGPSEDVIYTTLKGYHKKEAELRFILETEIPQNAEDLGRAAAHGDISENAEYSAALEKQEQLMRRVKELRDDLDKARILDPELVTTERVVVGTKVRVRNVGEGKVEIYSLLGPWDSDVARGIISYLSPVGMSLLGKKKGAEVEVQLPQGTAKYEVLDIEAAPSELLVAED